MMTLLIRFALSYRMLVVLAAVGLLAAGAYTTTTMPVDVFPDLTAPSVTVLTEAHGMAPTEVETLVTFPIESALNGAAGVRRVRSSTAVGISVVWVEFEWGTDIRVARQTVSEKLGLIAGQLPPELDPPVIAPQSSIMGEILFIGLTSEQASLFELRTLADTVLRRRLLAVAGVSQVVPIGGEVKQYQVVLAAHKLQAYGISSGQVAEALGQTNENATAGLLVDSGQELLIQGLGRIGQLRDVGQTVVAVRTGVPVKVADLGTVQIGAALRRGTGAVMGRPAVVMGIQKQPNTNTLALTAALDGVLDEIDANLPAGVQLHRNLFRQADFIALAVRNIEEGLRDGALLVVVVVVFFLGNLRASVITLTAIPLSLLATVMVLKAFGASINTMTLGGMAIAIGALVDDAIVDVENVYRRLRENALLPAGRRENPLTVIYHASIEIRASILFATLIVLLVFVPLFFLSGVEGRLLQPLGVAYVVALTVSLLVAVTVTPALCSYLLPRSRAIVKGIDPVVSRLSKRLYRPVLEWALEAPWQVAGAALVLLLIAVGSVPFFGQSFLPEFNEGALTISAVTLPGTSLAESNRLAQLVDEKLLAFPEVRSVSRRTGRAELDEHAEGVESSEIDVALDLEAAAESGRKPRTKDELIAAMRQELATVPGLALTLGQPLSHRIDHMVSGTRAAVAVKIFAPESDTASLYKLRELGRLVEAQMRQVPGVVDLSIEQQMEVPILRIAFDRQAIQYHGLTVRQVAHEIERACAGEVVTKILEGRNAFDLVVRVGDPAALNEQVIHQLPVTTASGALVPLRTLASIRRDAGPNKISRENVQRKIVVQCNVAERDLASVVADVQAKVAQNVPMGRDQYAGYYLQYGGQFENAQGTARLLAALSIAVVLCIGILLHVAFHSARDAMLVMLNLPLALIGGVLGVYVTGGVLTVASLVGFITLLGIATRNGIMLVSHIRHLQRYEGVDDFRTAVARGAIERLVPILMTALATGLALVPLALSGDRPGNEIQAPLAVVVLFGLASSTVLNMLVVPTLFLRWADPTPPEVVSVRLEAMMTPEPAAVRGIQPFPT